MALYILPCLDVNKLLTKMQAQRFNNETVTLLNFKNRLLPLGEMKTIQLIRPLKLLPKNEKTTIKCKNNIPDTRKS